MGKMAGATEHSMIECRLHLSIESEIYFHCCGLDVAAEADMNMMPIVNASRKTQVRTACLDGHALKPTCIS